MIYVLDPRLASHNDHDTISHPATTSHIDSSAVDQLQDLPLVLTPVEVARLLGIGRNSIYALLRSGAIRSIRVGKLFKIPRAALEEYLQGY